MRVFRNAHMSKTAARVFRDEDGSQSWSMLNIMNGVKKYGQPQTVCGKILYCERRLKRANVAQLAEQRFRKPQVKGSSPFIGSTLRGVAQFGSAFGSGPKGRRFKSCHLDQKPEQNVTFCPVFFYPLHKITGLYRIMDNSDTPGQQRILSDKCTLCLVAREKPVTISHNQTRPKGSNHHLQYDNSGLFTGLVSSQTAI